MFFWGFVTAFGIVCDSSAALPKINPELFAKRYPHIIHVNLHGKILIYLAIETLYLEVNLGKVLAQNA